MNNSIEILAGEIAMTRTAIEGLEKTQAEIEAKKQGYMHQLDILEEKLMLAKGKVFAGECLEGKHPTCTWADMPQYMRNDLDKIFQEIIDNKFDLEKFSEPITSTAYEDAMQEAINKFKEKYNITKILL